MGELLQSLREVVFSLVSESSTLKTVAMKDYSLLPYRPPVIMEEPQMPTGS